MGLQTFEISKGKTFVAGLFWQTLTRPQKMKDEIKNLASDLEFDFYVVRESSVPQVGLLSSADGATPGLMSCAAVISKATEMQGGVGSALVATKIPDGRFLFVAVRDGAILPECDFIAEEEVVERFYIEQLSMGEWHNRIAPDHWNIDGAQERDFTDLIPTKGQKFVFHNWWTILPIGGEKKKMVISIAVFVVLIAIGLFSYTKYKAMKESDANAQIAAAQELEIANKREEFAHIKIPHPWASMPAPNEFMNVCEAAFKNKYIFVAGWQLSEFSCDQTAANYKWKRQGTTFAELKKSIPDATSDALGEEATCSFPFALNPTIEETLITNVRDEFVEKLQQIGLKFSIASVPVVVPVPTDAAKDVVPPVADFKNFHWQLVESPLRPVTVGELLNIPGVRISKVVLNAKEGTIRWGYEGEIYEKN